jgi:hypothetical protein
MDVFSLTNRSVATFIEVRMCEYVDWMHRTSDENLSSRSVSETELSAPLKPFPGILSRASMSVPSSKGRTNT